MNQSSTGEPLTHALAADATLGDAAERIGRTLCPLLALVDEAGKVTGVVREEEVRLGLTGEGRPHHRLAGLAQPVGNFPEMPLDADGRVLPWTPPAPPAVRRALVMAGGRGSRLHSLTIDCPKPLLPIRGQPLLHRVLEQLVAAGIAEVYLSVHYLADKVKSSIGDGHPFGVQVHYVEETDPLGTAGALGLLPEQHDTLLVMNGDILTEINLRAFFAWHRRHGNAVTVATHLHEVHVPYGLAHFTLQRLEHLEEKPTLRLPVNAGMYLFEPGLLGDVPKGHPLDMVAWLNGLAPTGKLGHFPLVESWSDIGSREEYQQLNVTSGN